jgi:hypothetical protein
MLDTNLKKTFGRYTRLQTRENESTSDCGKIADVISWYQNEYNFARENINIEPSNPWAAFVQNQDGSNYILEQNEFLEHLTRQSSENPDQIDMEEAISKMAEEEEVHVIFD